MNYKKKTSSSPSAASQEEMMDVSFPLCIAYPC